MTDANPSTASAARSNTRRRFIKESGGVVAAMCALGLGLTMHARSARSVPPDVIRPPGAIAEDKFPGACLRCGLCVRDCPYDTLSLATLGDGIGVGTPYFKARDVPCEMCDDIPCVAACPSNALSKELTDINDARMGLAVLIDQENCLNYRGLRCDVCYRVCPVIDKAITLEPEHNPRTGKHARFLPIVHSDACTGCGKCEKSCVLDKAAIRVLPIALAKGSPDQHYRMGWEEKQKHGAPLLPDIIDLPDRMPGQAQ